jgi:hypothetical protein
MRRCTAFLCGNPLRARVGTPDPGHPARNWVAPLYCPTEQGADGGEGEEFGRDTCSSI